MRHIPLLQMPFRPFFLLAGLYSVLSILLWSLFWGFPQSVGALYAGKVFGGMLLWHSHELVFGFAGAVLIGFLFTAVRNWTGLPPLPSWQLGLLCAIWLLLRLAWWQPLFEPSLVLAALALCFWGLSAVLFAGYIFRRKMWRNGVFIVILLVMGALDIGSVLSSESSISQQLCRSGVWVLSLAVTIIGGRIIPFFTANATATPKRFPPTWIERTVIPLQGLLLLLAVSGLATSYPQAFNWLMLATGLMQLIRLGCWNWRAGLLNPMLWSLYLFYACLPLGLIGLGGLLLLGVAGGHTFFHFLTIGAIGGMILSMTSRVSLGHTGRPIKASAILIGGFILTGIAVCIRAVFPLMMSVQYWPQLYMLSGLIWVAIWLLWLVKFAPVLLSKRNDGKPG